MNIRYKRKKLTINALYKLLLIVTIFSFTFSESQLINSSFASTINALKYMCPIAVLFLYLCQNNTIKKKKCGILMLFVIASVIGTLIYDGGIMILLLVIVLLGASKLKIDEVFCITYRSIILSCLVVMILASIGIIINTVDIRWIGDYMGDFFSGQYVRHSMGFLNSNQVPTTFFICYLLLILWKGDTIPLWKTIIIQLLNYWMFFYFGSRITFLLIIITGIIFCIKKYHKEAKGTSTKKYRIICVTFFICFAFSLFTACAYKSTSSAWQYLDLLFNNRLRLASEAMKVYSISLFGYGKIAGTYDSLKNITVDNGYILLLIQRGLIITTIILLILSIGAKKIINTNKYVLMVLCIFAVENIINAHLISYKVIPLYCMIVKSWDKEFNFMKESKFSFKK